MSIYSPANCGKHIYDLGHVKVQELDPVVIENVRKFKRSKVEYSSFSYEGQFNNLDSVSASIAAKFGVMGIGFESQAFMRQTCRGQNYSSEEVEWEFNPSTTIRIRVFKVEIHCHRHTINNKGQGVPNGQQVFTFIVKLNPMT